MTSAPFAASLGWLQPHHRRSLSEDCHVDTVIRTLILYFYVSPTQKALSGTLRSNDVVGELCGSSLAGYTRSMLCPFGLPARYRDVGDDQVRGLIVMTHARGVLVGLAAYDLGEHAPGWFSPAPYMRL